LNWDEVAAMERSTCEKADELIQKWERTGTLNASDFTLLNEHLELCQRCASMHGALVPLLRRDAGGSSGLSADPGPLAEGFTEGLMGTLAASGNRSRGAFRARRGRVAPRLRFVLAIAAVLVVAGGILFWIWRIQPGKEDVLVRFELVAPDAQSVNLVGDFSDWNPHSFAMKDATGEGNWQIKIRLKRGQVYTYNFLMDGRQWIADPNSLRQVDDGFGGKSSVLEM
jgi:hypothetical protein